MSNASHSRPASLVSVLAILCCFGVFFLLVYLAYLPNQSGGAFEGNGILTAEQRKEKLTELRANEAKHESSYAWIDQSAGVVQLPIERAMELTVQRYQSRN